jgi:ferredoxin-NADP reductase
MKISLDHVEDAGRGIKTFYFKPEKPLHYTAGQFIELYIMHEHKDKRGEKRWFTLSSPPAEELVSITTRLASSQGSSFKAALSSLHPGDIVHMSAPMGDFVLPKDPTIPLLFVAGGIGSTPFHSIIHELQLQNEQRDVTLLYAARTPEDVAFKDIFSSLGDKFKIVLTEPSKDWDGPAGKLTAESVLALGQPTPEHYIYISGPEPMIETLYKDLKKSGVNKRHLFTDYFLNYSAIL